MSSVTRRGRRIALAALLLACQWGIATVLASKAAHDVCSRPASGATVEDPEEPRSQDGVLKVDRGWQRDIETGKQNGTPRPPG